MAPEGRGGLFGRLFYYTAFFLIVVGVAKFYLIWLENYRLLHPEVIEALAAGYIEEQPLEGILLWDEQLVYAPTDISVISCVEVIQQIIPAEYF